MADENKIKQEIEIVGVVDKKKSEQAGKDMADSFKKGIGNNGYIQLEAEITKYRYPKQTKHNDGTSSGYDYSKLQKAQDELISNWNKLSKRGFSSSNEEIVETLKSYRNYLRESNSQYRRDINRELKDKQLAAIKRVIGTQLTKNFTNVLGKIDIGAGQHGSLMNIFNDSEFEKRALEAIRKT